MNAHHIIKREYVESIRTKSFLISTILVPVMMVAFLFVPLLSAFFVSGDQVTVAVVDRTGEVAEDFTGALDDTLKDGRPKYLVSPVITSSPDFDREQEELITLMNNERLDILIDIPEDVFSLGKVFYITKGERILEIIEKFENSLGDIILKRRLASEGLDYEQVAALTRGISLEVRKTTKSGSMEERSFLGEWGLVFMFVMILYMALLTWGITIQRSIIEEKGSRVIEVLLSSVSPMDLFVGKIVGIGLLGLTQLIIWVVAGLSIGFYTYYAAAHIFSYINVPPSVLVYFIVYFVLGFLLYASIFTIVGAICSTEQDAQQLQGLVTLPLIVPILVLMLIIQSPNSNIAVVLSLIPIFTPMLMMARVVVLQPDFWQILLSVVILLVSIYGAVYFSSRVFRVGILMYGKRPGMREIIRWYRHA
ncbi:MAG: ABC transporter permease [Candidatus Latescibacteria bacterium]|nr:ABC transporter permease [Candidatus Latescibacterota bacterium]NIM64496.1 ABC transporter permease [Candidatus Latescibacterota bacterium]NIO00649.1 ABC transporter permease [Candidatus Latescibacterota bacterium]NIO27052.1 ABC transporter permease [Candidatus Latescibacterota bacterium]NIO54576.1 ABC transporter permease [Candidatus Latescibacterota bacterium]